MFWDSALDHEGICAVWACTPSSVYWLDFLSERVLCSRLDLPHDRSRIRNIHMFWDSALDHGGICAVWACTPSSVYWLDSCRRGYSAPGWIYLMIVTVFATFISLGILLLTIWTFMRLGLALSLLHLN
jgi:hypothetical protein